MDAKIFTTNCYPAGKSDQPNEICLQRYVIAFTVLSRGFTAILICRFNTHPFLLQIDTFVPESKVYTELCEFEKKIDSIILLKRLDIQEAVGKPAKSMRTLRIFVSNTAADQPMQQQQN